MGRITEKDHSRRLYLWALICMFCLLVVSSLCPSEAATLEPDSFLGPGHHENQVAAGGPPWDGPWLETSQPPQYAVINKENISAKSRTRVIGNWPFGPCFTTSVDPQRELAFVGSGGGVHIVSIADRSKPKKEAEIKTAGVVDKLFFSNSMLYIASREDGLQIYDVSTPTEPKKIGSLNTPGLARDVFVSGSYAYVADGDAGLQIVDVSNPVAPKLTGSLDPGGYSPYARGVYVSGHYAYLAGGRPGLQIIDVSNPTAPKLVGSYDSPGYGEHVFVSGSYAYLIAWNLEIIDVSNPAEPNLVGTYNTPCDAQGVYVSGSYVYVADWYDGLMIFDVENPAAPELVGSYETGSAEGIYVSGTYAYVADAEAGLQIINVSNPAVPTFAGLYYTSGLALDVFVSGSYAYLADLHYGLQIIDISNRASPKLAGAYHTIYGAHGVYVSGSYAYVAHINVGLEIIDISNPVAPKLAGTYYIQYPEAVFVSGYYAYVAGYSGLQIIDVSNPAEPKSAGSFKTPDAASGVYVSGSYAYVADRDSGLQIIDVSNPAAPKHVGAYDTPGKSSRVYVSGSYAYVADGDAGLQIIDVSNPTKPTFAGSFKTPDWARGVYVSGSYAYVADRDSGLQIIDVANPATPKIAGAYDTPGWPCMVYISACTAYVADNWCGLIIIKHTPPFPADDITMLVPYPYPPDEPNDPSDTRTPLILVHGIHGTEDWDENGILDELEAVEQHAGWKRFLEYFDSNPELNSKYKIFRFLYLSDLQPVTEIGRSFRNHLDRAISQGDMNDLPVVLLAHSMGGLVSRSLMQKYEGTTKIKKLITLATPHHGSPGANDTKALRKLFAGGQYGEWRGVFTTIQLLYNLSSSAHGRRWDVMVDSAQPNRSDLRWDNKVGSTKVRANDANVWLSELNNSLQDNIAQEIITYSGYIDSQTKCRKFWSIPGHILANIISMPFDSDHKNLCIAGAIMDAGLDYSFPANDGMVPLTSGRLHGHKVAKRVTCPGHDHLDMLRGYPEKKCSTKKTLFDSLKDDLSDIANSP